MEELGSGGSNAQGPSEIIKKADQLADSAEEEQSSDPNKEKDEMVLDIKDADKKVEEMIKGVEEVETA